MPRIPAAIAVVMLVATCIGFNTARFPVVLEMAAVPDMSCQTKVVAYPESPTDSNSSEYESDATAPDASGEEEGSSYGRRSSWSSYGSESDRQTDYDSYNSYGSYGDEEGSDWDEEQERSDDGSSHGYGYKYDDNESDSESDSYGYGSTYESSTDEDSYGYGYDSSSDDGTSEYDRDSSSGDGSYGYGGQSSYGNDSSGYGDSDYDESEYGKEESSWGSGASAEDSSDGYADKQPADGWNSDAGYSYDDSSSGKSSGYAAGRDAYSYQDNSYGSDSPRGSEAALRESRGDEDFGGGTRQESGLRGASHGDYASVDNRDTRYGERQGAAADNSSTWSGGAPVTASPARPYAYGTGPYEDSAAASANAAPRREGLGLVPVSEDRESADAWDRDEYDDRRDSSYSRNTSDESSLARGYSTSSPPAADLEPLPPVDPYVQGPSLSSLREETIPLYPSTDSM